MSSPVDPRRALLARLMSPEPEDDGLFEALGDDAVALLDALVDELPPVTPSVAARSRLIRAARPQPFAAFLEPLAQLFEIAVETARDYLGALSDEDAWHAMMDGIALQHVQGGPTTASADVGFVRVAPNLDFPPHVHVGEERNLVLDGSLIDGDGTTYGPGDLFVHPAGSHHVFRSGSRGVLFAVVVWGVDFGADIDIHEDG